MSASRVGSDLLLEAAELIHGQRAIDYGDPRENFARIAALWTVVLGIKVAPWQVAVCMLMLKVARIVKTPSHRDSWLDSGGYVAHGAMLALDDDGAVAA